GEVAMVNGAVVVTTKEGLLRVEGSGPAVEVAKGKTITVRPKAARAPQGGAGAGVSSATALQVGAVGTGVASTVMSGIAISRAGDARDAAAAADATAASAVSAANAAKSAADSATDAANAAGCALNDLLPASTSPFTPPDGSSCP
ncbi:MAG TPA: hypothetical protein VM182_12455, partial [Terriglobia bacterium]|nr:hypothetical protein [Terriglobia bacterium]